PDGAIGTNHLQIVELVRRSSLDGALYGRIEPRGALRCVEPEVLLVCRRGQRSVAPRNIGKPCGPDDAVGFWIPPPTAHMRHALCFSEFLFPSVKSAFGFPSFLFAAIDEIAVPDGETGQQSGHRDNHQTDSAPSGVLPAG